MWLKKFAHASHANINTPPFQIELLPATYVNMLSTPMYAYKGIVQNSNNNSWAAMVIYTAYQSYSWASSHFCIASLSLFNQAELSRIASQFCLITLSALGHGFSLKNISISVALSSDTNPAVAIYDNIMCNSIVITWYTSVICCSLAKEGL